MKPYFKTKAHTSVLSFIEGAILVKLNIYLEVKSETPNYSKSKKT